MTIVKATAVASSLRFTPLDIGAPLCESLIDSLTRHAVFALSPSGTIVSWNTGAQRLFGYLPAEIIGRRFDVLFAVHDVKIDTPRADLAAARSGAHAGRERLQIRADGTAFLAQTSVTPLLDRHGGAGGFAVVVHDATESHAAIVALRVREEKLRSLVDSVGSYAILSIEPDGTIGSWNAGARATFGYTDAEIVGRPFATLFTADDRAAGVPQKELRNALGHGSALVERWLVRKDASRFLAGGRCSVRQAGAAGKPAGFVLITHDVTERTRLGDELRRNATSDPLTNLLNRTAFLEHVNRAIGSMKRRSTNMFGVLFIDLDRFKSINDNFGHATGDALLALTARRLEQCVRSGDIVARFGGDEFAILLNGIDGLSDAHDAADRIGLAMAAPVTIHDCDLRATASVGIALGSTTYAKAEDVLADADAAMYAAKSRGRARTTVFDSSMRIRNRRTEDLDTEMRHAVERNELRIAYQPIVELSGGALAGFEALVRWQHPRRGLLAPAAFIPIAEQTDAVVAIDSWVLGTACGQLKQWQREHGASLHMSVNFSSKHFARADVLDRLAAIVDAAGVAPASLRIEVTETAMLDRSQRTLNVLNEIRKRGFKLQVDDFGIGYSSLSLLQFLPIDGLKIDRSFVAELHTASGAEIVRSVITLAHNLGFVAVAEGIETAAQLRRLRELECELGQGVFFCGPLDPPAADEYLRTAQIAAAG